MAKVVRIIAPKREYRPPFKAGDIIYKQAEANSFAICVETPRDNEIRSFKMVRLFGDDPGPYSASADFWAKYDGEIVLSN